MKTYTNDTHLWFYDIYIKLWTIYEIDSEENQTSDADYHNDRKQLEAVYPFTKLR